MSAQRPGPPEPPTAPEQSRAPAGVSAGAAGVGGAAGGGDNGGHSASAPAFRTRAERRAARERSGPDIELPAIAHTPRYVSLIATAVSAVLIAVSALAGEWMLALALALGSVILAWGWPRAAGLPSPVGASIVLALTALALVGAVLVAEDAPFLRWAAGALALGLVAMFLQQLLRRDGRPRLVESVLGTSLGLVVFASGVSYLALVHLEHGPALIVCAMAAVVGGSLADLLVSIAPVRPWLLPLSMVLGGVASVLASSIVEAPDLPPAALIGVACGALAHAFRRLLSPEAGSYSSQGQIAAGMSSVAIVGALLWMINDLVVR
ncbi:MAG: hypothetical protein Q4G67_05965 [Actinomycetia bacterium]|nr:hypothetical protein [Actinomycetes bacterium]